MMGRRKVFCHWSTEAPSSCAAGAAEKLERSVLSVRACKVFLVSC